MRRWELNGKEVDSKIDFAEYVAIQAFVILCFERCLFLMTMGIDFFISVVVIIRVDNIAPRFSCLSFSR